MTKPPLTFDDLPMFATDAEIGEVVLGVKRKGEFHALADVLESRGMPKVDVFWGGRCVEAVRKFILASYGLTTDAPLAPHGVEGQWRKPKHQAAHKVPA